MLNTNEIIKKIDLETNYTYTETARLIGMSTTAVGNNVRRGNIKSVLILGRNYINGRDIIRSLGVEPA